MSPALLHPSLLLSRPGSTRPSRSRSCRPSLALALGLLAAVASTPASVRAAEVRPAQEAVETREETDAFRHLRALSQIATRHGGNRAAGTPGYDASANYIGGRLREAGYAVRFEPFEVPVSEERSPPRLSLVPGQAAEQALSGDEVRTLAHSGRGEVSGPIAPVDLGFASDGPPGPSTSGCEAEDFASFPRGTIALLGRGTCPFQVKVERAVEAGAAGLVVMNEGGEGRTAVFSGNLARSAPVPVLGVSTRLGRELEAASRAGIPVRLGVDAASEIRRTHNVIAETPGDPSRTVVVAVLHGSGERAH